ncbi:MAG: 50S ribosomal protein L29 [Candidatus Pacebacteria bacterium]|nr:50S ribosomal protein L29 [Candidatus Paceibacterota bacterium]
MKSNDIKALPTKTISELQQQLTELQQQFAKAKLARKAGKEPNTKLVSNLADDIARVKTVLHQKTLLKQAANKVPTQQTKTKKANKKTQSKE